MFDQETLRPVIVSMIVYLVMAKMIPKIFKKPVDIEFIDDIVKFFIIQDGMLSSGAIVTGLIVYITNQIIYET
jgi:hypothetical protein